MGTDLIALERNLTPMLPRFEEVLRTPGVNLPAPRLVRSMLISCERTPKLLDCTMQSLFNAAMSAACLGLEVDGVTGQAYLIPFKGVAQLVIGYKGYNTLAARSGITITGEAVREGDAFDFDEGEGWVKHKKKLGGGERKIIAVWAKAAANDRPAAIKVLDIADVLAIKAKSPGAAKQDSPWNDAKIGFPAMAEKSAKRRLGRTMPLNVVQLAARMDEAFEEQGLASRITPEQGVVIDAQAEPVEAPPPAELTTVLKPEPIGATAKEPTVSDQLAIYDKILEAAAQNGVGSLENAWYEIPYEYRTSLKSALERRHKPTALAAQEKKK